MIKCLSKIKPSLLLSVVFVLLTSCSKQPQLVEEVWTPKDGSADLTALKKPGFKQTERSLLVKTAEGTEVVERATQFVGKAEVELSFQQKIKNSLGQYIFIKTLYTESELNAFAARSEILYRNRFLFLNRQQKLIEDLRTSPEIFSPKVILATEGGRFQLLYQIDYLNSAKTGIYRIRMTPEGRILSNLLASSGFEGRATIFPIGPKLSELTEVVLQNLNSDGSLSKPSLKIAAQVSEKAHSPNFIFDYDPQDVRFDQVQSFYYTDKALNFFKNKLGVTLPFGLEVQTHFGAPEKLNAMFYYHGQVRLGTGDGISYSQIMKDPNIVFHEASHALVEALAKLPMGQGEGGSLNEAYSDYFAAAMTKNPNMGDVAYLKAPFKRSLINDKTLKEKNGGLYNDSLIVSGLLWDIHQSLGEDKALSFAVRTLVRMGPSGNLDNFKDAIDYAAINFLSEAEKLTVDRLLRKRGW